MDLYQKITEHFLNLPVLEAWTETHALFTRIAANKPYHWSLPVLACRAAGGTQEDAIAAALAIACSHISIILVDDMLDADPRGEYVQMGMPAAANLACALQAAALEAIFPCGIEADVKMSILNCLNEMTLTTTLGQYWDTQGAADEAAYWRIVKTKSSPFFGSALQIGALLGGVPFEISRKLGDLGRLYGEMIQLHDDLNDVMEVPANPDWTEARSPLPILFARLVDHPARARFLELCRHIRDEGALEEAQEILIRSGAVSYCIDQLTRRHQAARKILDSTALPQPAALEELIEEVIEPVHRLFQSMSEIPPTNEPGNPV